MLNGTLYNENQVREVRLSELFIWVIPFRDIPFQSFSHEQSYTAHVELFENADSEKGIFAINVTGLC